MSDIEFTMITTAILLYASAICYAILQYFVILVQQYNTTESAVV